MESTFVETFFLICISIPYLESGLSQTIRGSFIIDIKTLTGENSPVSSLKTKLQFYRFTASYYRFATSLFPKNQFLLKQQMLHNSHNMHNGGKNNCPK